MKKSWLTLSALALCLAAGSAMAKEWKEIRFGVDTTYPPFESQAADGSFVLGIETGIASITVSRSNYHTQTFTAEAVDGQEVNMGTLTLANTDGAPPPPPFEEDP